MEGKLYRANMTLEERELLLIVLFTFPSKEKEKENANDKNINPLMHMNLSKSPNRH